MTFGKAAHYVAYATDIPGSRVDPDDDFWPCAYEVLDEPELLRELHAVGNARSTDLHDGQAKADWINFQPCSQARSQDRAVIREINVHGKKWIVAGVFDGWCEHILFCDIS
jgi:pyruvate dehydrogenase phosphatase